MTPSQIVKHYDGSISFAAYNLGYTESAVRNWVKENRVPIKAQKLVELVTGGRLKADKVKKVLASPGTAD